MRDAAKVASLCDAMQKGLEEQDGKQGNTEQRKEVPVTVKCRIGVDDSGFVCVCVFFVFSRQICFSVV